MHIRLAKVCGACFCVFDTVRGATDALQPLKCTCIRRGKVPH